MTTIIEIEQAMETYKMPQFNINEIITWWPSGQAGSGSSEVAIIQQLHENRIEAVVLARDGLVVRPFYKSDPRLLVEAYREEGCFDVPPNSNAQRLADIEDRLAEVERALDALPAMQSAIDNLLRVNLPPTTKVDPQVDDEIEALRSKGDSSGKSTRQSSRKKPEPATTS